MSLDDLFGLLLFLAFVILPTLGRATRGKKPAAPPARPTASTAPRPSASAPPVSPTAGAPVAGDTDELERRLAEARERVRRAMEGPSSAPRSAPTPAATPAPTRPAQGGPATASGSAPSPRRPAPVPLVRDRDDGLLSTPLAPQAFAGLGREGPSARVSPRAMADAPALQVERRAPGPGRSRSAPVFSTDPQTLVSAIVWHQVLGEPRARRPAGGRPSTLRSR